ncbi:MAG: PAS domain-containing protein [Salinivirgaceae bacterium]
MRIKFTNYKFLTATIALLITVLFAISLIWNINNEYRVAYQLAKNEAISSFNKDMVFRKWVSGHGGVYVPISDQTPPNPNLKHISERDIVTDSGVVLTLMNPAYVMRQIHALGKEQYGTPGHLISVNDYYHETLPDEWEHNALEEIKKNPTLISQIDKTDGEEFIRVINPVFYGNDCLKCHQNDEINLGSLAGAISVKVPLKKYSDLASKKSKTYALMHLGLFSLVVVIMLFGYQSYQQEFEENRRFEEKLVANDKKLLEVQRMGQIAYWHYDRKSKTFEFSNDLYKLVGIYPKDFNGTLESYVSTVDEHDYKTFKRELSLALQNGSAFDRIYRIRNTQGEEKSLHLIINKVPIDAPYIIGFIQDITTQMQTEKRLIQNENEFRLLFENMSSAFAYHKIITNSNGKPIDYVFIDINNKYEELTGLRKEKIIGKRVLEIIPNLEQEWIEKFGQVALTGIPTEYTNYVEAFDRYYQTKVYSPQMNHFVVVFFEITEQIKTQQALKASEERYQLAIAASNLGIWDWFTDSDEVYYSDLWKLQLGYQPHELEGKFETWKELLHPDDKWQAVALIEKYLKHPQGQFVTEFRLRHKDGHYVWIHNRAEALVDEQNKVKRMFGTHLDITKAKLAQLELNNYQQKLEHLVHERTNELMQSNEELNSANEELMVINEKLANQKQELEQTLERLKKTQSQLIQSEKMASLGVLIAGIAHEINNPINFISCGIDGIKIYLEQINDCIDDCISKQKMNSQVKEAQLTKTSADEIRQTLNTLIEGMELGVSRTVSIVNGLRSFSRSDETNIQQFDLHPLIDNTLLILYNQYKNRIEIQKQYGDIPKLNGFPGQISQVVMNLIINAIQAIPAQGTITISTKTKGEKVQLTVQDTGTGIPENIRNLIFDPFFTTKEAGKGTGLGLSISYNIIKEHKGVIKVESEPNQGTRFIVELPVN